jgi:hypothetical protein
MSEYRQSKGSSDIRDSSLTSVVQFVQLDILAEHRQLAFCGAVQISQHKHWNIKATTLSTPTR